MTALIELLTIVLRFGFHIEANRDTAAAIGPLTGGVRIHHAYLGLLIIIFGRLFSRRNPALSKWLLIAGMALFFSDIIHHFLVLWPITGDPQLHLFYPPH